MAHHADIVVIGAGIAGLTAAFMLHEEGRHVLVLEKADRAGGAIHTVSVDGFQIEEGPNSILDTSPEVTDLLEHIGLAEQRVFAREASSKRYVVRGGRMIPLPLSPGQFLRTPLFSFGAKMRLLREPFISAGQNDEEESVADFVRRRLGREFLDYAINPFVAGVYAGDPNQLSVEHAFPKLYALEARYGGLIRGQIMGARERKKSGRPSKQRARMYSFEEGLGVLPSTLAAQLGDRVRCGAAVQRIAETDASWEVTYTDKAGAAHSVKSSSVVYTGRITDFADIASGLELEALSALEVTYPPVTVLGLGFHRDAVIHSLDGFGVLVPEVEQRRILGALFSSTLFPCRTPADHILLTVFVGGARQPDMALFDTDTLLPLVLRDLEDLVGAKNDPVMVHRRTWRRAIPQYTLGYGDVKAALDHLEKAHPGLYFAGNYRGGISVPDTMTGSLALAERVG